MKLLTLLESAPTPSNTEGSFTVGQVKFDNVHGLGATPNNRNVDYMGCVAWLKPSVFERIAKPSDEVGERAEGILEQLNAGKAIGCPFLLLYVTGELPQPETVACTGHEGRARAKAFKSLNGDVPMPVHFFFRPELRARHLSVELFTWLNEHGIIAEGSTVHVKPNIKRYFLSGKDIGLG